MEEQLSMEGNVAIITGAARGIGKHIATRFVERGASVVLSDVRDELGEQTSAELGSSAEYVHCDISALGDVKSMIEGTVERFGRIDILINNAAYNPSTPEERTTVDEYADEVFVKMIDVDINGTYYCSKYAARQMITQKSGVIINIGSVAGVVPIRNQIGHVVGKAGVIRMAGAMALELGCHGIRVNSISPGSTITDATRGLFYNEEGGFNEQGKKLLSFVPAGRPGQTDDVANAALFLASDMASYVTGQNIVVDGGWICGFTRDF